MIRRLSVFLVLEFALAAIIIGGLIYSFWHVAVYGYFPQPFFYNINDTWMDWFNPAYWAHQPGTYDSFQSIYPPLTFVILKTLTFGPCYVSAEGGASRSCDWYGIATLHLTYITAVVLTVMFYLKVDRRTARIEQRGGVAVVRRDPRERRRQQGARRRPLLHRGFRRRVGRRRLHRLYGRQSGARKQQRAERAGHISRARRLRRHFHLPHGQIIPIPGLPCPAGGRPIPCYWLF